MGDIAEWPEAMPVSCLKKRVLGIRFWLMHKGSYQGVMGVKLGGNFRRTFIESFIGFEAFLVSDILDALKLLMWQMLSSYEIYDFLFHKKFYRKHSPQLQLR